MTRSRQLAIVARYGISLFTGIVLLLHSARRDIHPGRRYISEYAVGPYGWLMSVGFVGISVGSLALTLALKREMPGPRTGLCLIPLKAYGVFMGIVALFPTDLSVPGAGTTSVGRIHNAAARWAARSIVIAILLLSRRFGRYRNWRDLRRRGSALGIFAALAMYSVGRWPSMRPGLSQRAFFACVLLWLHMLAHRLATLTQATRRTE